MNVTITDSEFKLGLASIVNVYGNRNIRSTLTVTNSLFQNIIPSTSAQKKGGVVNIEGMTYLTISKSAFTNNSVLTCGLLYIIKTNTTIIKNSTFFNNSFGMEAKGAIVSVYDSLAFHLSNSVFDNSNFIKNEVSAAEDYIKMLKSCKRYSSRGGCRYDVVRVSLSTSSVDPSDYCSNDNREGFLFLERVNLINITGNNAFKNYESEQACVNVMHTNKLIIKGKNVFDGCSSMS